MTRAKKTANKPSSEKKARKTSAKKTSEAVKKDINDVKSSPLAETSSASSSSGRENNAPGIHVAAQYIKDLSFENPDSPASLAPASGQPKLNVNVHVDGKKLSDNDYEVILKIEAKAENSERTLFIVELSYAGIFQLRNIPPEHIQPVIMIESPRMLFPFARQIIADATRNGGFPQLMLDPIDFATLYEKNLTQKTLQ